MIVDVIIMTVIFADAVEQKPTDIYKKVNYMMCHDMVEVDWHC